MATEFMEVPRARQMASKFSDASDILDKVSKALELAIRTLQTTAFIGHVGGIAVIRYLEVLQPQIEELARKCDEISNDIELAIQGWETATQIG